VAREGKKRLELVYVGSRRTLDYGVVVNDFTALLEKNVSHHA
jgi:hypothetical protein